MLPGWMGWNPQLAVMSSNPLLMGSQSAASGTPRPAVPQVPSPLIKTPPVGTPEEQKEKERAVVVRALREIAEKKAQEEAQRKSREGDEPKEEQVVKKKENEDEDADKKPRCHLHRKPNAKCKKCQAVLASQQSQSSSSAGDKGTRGEEADPKLEGRRGASPSRGSKEKEKLPFQCSQLLKEQIAKSSYFRSLQDLITVENLATEIREYADTLDVYNIGSRTEPSCFICLVLRLSQMSHIEDGMHIIVDNRHDAKVRCVGFLYLRFVTAPVDLFEVFEEFLLDDMELVYTQDGAEIRTTIGEYVESLLVKEKYFDTPLPRIPVRIRQQLEEKVAPMSQFRKRMKANRKAIRNDNVEGMPVEVNLDGQWVHGTAQELLFNVYSRPRVRVQAGDSSSTEYVKVALGKVVIADEYHESDHEGQGLAAASAVLRRQQRRSRSRSRQRERSRSRERGEDQVAQRWRSRSRSRSRGSRSPSPAPAPEQKRSSPKEDWSRWKGKSDAEMVEELRARLRDNAVCSGKTYPKRPLTFDASMASTAMPPPGNVIEVSQEGSTSTRRRRKEEENDEDDEITLRLRREKEDARARHLHNVYQKYCASSASASARQAAAKEVDTPDVLRLG